MNHETCPMIWEGNLQKMGSVVSGDGQVDYLMRGQNVLEPIEPCGVNEWVGRTVTIQFAGQINCVETGQSIKKTFGEGLSYQAFLRSPLACPSILRPELSRIHEGIALRDEAWEREHHLVPHVVYVSHTSHLKVGVTRASNVPSRWVDQGAVGAIIVANTPYRQLAGELEVHLKDVLSDRTNWRGMLQDVTLNAEGLIEAKDECLDALGATYEDFFVDADEIVQLHYPIQSFPGSIKSLKLEKTPLIQGKLHGVKGQYWMFEGGGVWNVRSHAGYRVHIQIN